VEDLREWAMGMASSPGKLQAGGRPRSTSQHRPRSFRGRRRSYSSRCRSDSGLSQGSPVVKLGSALSQDSSEDEEEEVKAEVSIADTQCGNDIDDLMASAIQKSIRLRTSADSSWKVKATEEHPKAGIVLTHKAPHTLDCGPVCIKHVYFLIRVLPTGRVTPIAELGIPALANIARRHEEQFCVKTYADFEQLNAAMCDAQNSAVSVVPELPSSCLQRRSLWGRMTTGVKHNPELTSQLQTYIDTILCQLPAHGTKSEPALASFFCSNRVDLTHPLVQQVLPTFGGNAPDFGGPDIDLADRSFDFGG